ncbi:MAG: Mov34/MPN/PAD-1 family protein [Myxococcota bacterium]
MGIATDRIELDENLPPVAIPPRILHELYQHALDAQKALGEECCGLVLSDQGLRYGRVLRCRNQVTFLHQKSPSDFPRDGTSAYHMDEHDVLAASREAESRGEEITAVYHSHVGAGAYLSKLDLDYARHPLFPFPKADQIVISVYEGSVVESGIFLRSGLDFAAHRLEAEPA